MRPETTTRQEIIDDQLRRAGWAVERRNLLKEYPLRPDLSEIHEASASYATGAEFADYVLLGPDHKPLAVVEAKHTGRDALAGQRQAADYADRLRAQHGFDPFVFLSNGVDCWFWDRDRYPLRRVSGFFTPDDLQRLAFQRQYGKLLRGLAAAPTIAGRPYQVEAIKRTTEAIETGQRKFLLVMATGTGKTRTVVALIDLLLRAGRAQRILFLADRRELARQALAAFKEHLPNETRATIEGGVADPSARLHVATYPSMMQVYGTLSPGYYDLIVADESHRSIYNRYSALFTHFDALQLGLTATPTDYIDHNTFELFECPDGLPTFVYPYESAVDEGYLVTYRVLAAQTTFQLQGIKAGQLPLEIQRQVAEQGIDLGEIDFEGSELERRVTNTSTNDAIVQEFMTKARKDSMDTLPAKTILFAISHAHAVELWESFNRLYPDLQRRGFAEIIDSHMERADQTLDDFKRRDMPRVALSVDMLDTGVDVPALQNLVFAKPVFSQVKFWQMIGRGTRLYTDPLSGQVKADFLIIDYWNNFAYFNMSPDGEISHPTEPLPVRLFRLRLDTWRLLAGQCRDEEAAAVRTQLQGMLAQLPTDNSSVRSYLADLAELGRPEAWDTPTLPFLERLSAAIAPALRFLPDITLPVMSFEALTERLIVSHLEGNAAAIPAMQEKVIRDLNLLPDTLREVQEHAPQRLWMTSSPFWAALDYGRLRDLQTAFAPLMRYRRPERADVVRLSLPDQIGSRRWIVYGPGGEGAFAETYREQVEAYVRGLADSLPALRKLRQGTPLADADLNALADALNRADLFITEDTLRQVYGQADVDLSAFLRHILGLHALPSREDQIGAVFESFLAEQPHFTATQVLFLRTVRSAVLRGTRLTEEDLRRLPFSRVGAVSRLFHPNQVARIIEFANALAA